MTFDEAGKLAVAGDPAARFYWAALAIITTLPGYSDKTPDVAHAAAQKVADLMYAGDCFVSQVAPTDDPTIYFTACDGIHIIKREHQDSEGGRAVFNADEHDLWQSGYVKIATVRQFVEDDDLSALDDFFCEGPEGGESDASIEHAAKLEQARTPAYPVASQSKTGEVTPC